jgi:Fur family transcriptional regulator, ferric uptake regulator
MMDTRHTSLVSLLSAKGVRLTRPRRAVLAVLAEARRPMSVAEIHARLSGRDVNLGSVYRTVALLCRLDVMRLADESRGTQRFELGEDFTGHHHHLVCQRCGDVQDLEGCVLQKPVLTRLQKRIRRVMRFQVMDHDVRLYGVCGRCAGASPDGMRSSR